MTHTARLLSLTIRAWLEYLRFDLVVRFFSYERIHQELRGFHPHSRPKPLDEAVVERASRYAACGYFRPVRCLQRSVAVVRLLRSYGIPAELVIGCRNAPFIGHAWVELDGRVVNDSPVYRDELMVLDRV